MIMYKSAFYTAMVLMLMGCGGGSSSAPITKVPHASDTPTIETNIEQAYLNAINNKRSKQQDCGSKGMKPTVTPLAWNDALYKAAYEHSEDLAESSTFSHVGSGTTSDWTAQVQNLGRGSTFKERIENNGYANWKNLGENIAKGQTTVEDVVSSWMNNPGHCANIMNSKYNEIGMAQYKKEGVVYWTQNFGAR